MMVENTSSGNLTDDDVKQFALGYKGILKIDEPEAKVFSGAADMQTTPWGNLRTFFFSSARILLFRLWKTDAEMHATVTTVEIEVSSLSLRFNEGSEADCIPLDWILFVETS